MGFGSGRRHGLQGLSVAARLLLALLALLSPLAACQAADKATDALLAAGEALYTRGELSGGQALMGRRVDGSTLRGADAACVSCHQRSGLGSVEGQIFVPPITGRALLGQGAPVVVRVNRRLNATVSSPHAGYTQAQLATLLRDGVTPDGQSLHALMPRFDLDAQAQAGLTTYLQTLSAENSPGADAQTVHLASVVAPGMDPIKEAAWVQTLQILVSQHNLLVNSGLRQKISATERRLQSRRRWSLSIWKLAGPSATWGAQLQAWHQAQPVFALLSGYGRHVWQPVQDFCDSQQVVCWFPSLAQPPLNAAQSPFSLYFSNGLALQASAVALRMKTQAERAGPSRPTLLWLHAADAPMDAVAQGLAQHLAPTAYHWRPLPWSAASAGAIAEAVRALRPEDTLVVDLQGRDLEQLLALEPGRAPVYFLAQPRATLPALATSAWQRQAFWVDPLERPEQSRENLAHFQAWAQSRQLPIVDLQLQSEAFVATQMLSWSLADMLNNLHTSYLVERAEQTLSMREDERVQMEVQGLMMGGGTRQPAVAGGSSRPQVPSLAALMNRRGMSAYPKLSLGPGQRFASKGVYIVPVQGDTDAQAPLWITP